MEYETDNYSFREMAIIVPHLHNRSTFTVEELFVSSQFISFMMHISNLVLKASNPFKLSSITKLIH